MRIGALTLLATAFVSTTPAQEALTPFDAPQLAFPYYISITSVGDFDADGDVDAFGWYWRYRTRFDQIQMHTFWNDGSGAFRDAQLISLAVSGGPTMSWDTEVGNLEAWPGDDVAVAFDTAVRTYKAVPSGTGSSVQQTYSTWVEPFPVQDLVLADLDRDGLDDLALVGAEVKVYRNTGTNFVLAASHALAGSEIFSGDFDLDGVPDLLVPTSGGVTMLRYQAGALQVIGSYSHGVQPGEGPMTVVGDSDADGDTDVVVFTEAGEYVTLRCIAQGQFVIEPRATGGPATGFADLDGDGDLDGVCCGGGGPAPAVNTMSSTYHVAMNLGGGRFAQAYSVRGLGAFRLAGAVDVDGDGDNDLVAGRSVWFNRGAFAVDLQPDVSLALPASLPLHPATVVDPDHDGDPDLAHQTGYVLRNDGAGNFRFSPPVLPDPPTGTQYGREGYRGDFDGDGDEDLILAHTNGQTLLGMRLFRNTGGGGYTDGGYALPPGTAFSNSMPGHRWDRLHAVGDLDGDGDQDIAQGHTTGVLDVILWWNDGTGFFTRGPSFPSGVPQAICDLDQDGHMDLVTHRDRWMGDGQGGFTRVGGFAGIVEPEHDHMTVEDVDGDGLLDVAIFDQSSWNWVLVYFNNGNRVFQQRAYGARATTRSAPHGIDVADFDGDGNKDLLVWPGVATDGTDIAQVLYGDGARNFTRGSKMIMHVAGPLADVDGDGDMDAYGTEVVRGVLYHAFDDGYRQQFGAASPGTGGFAPTLGATGPFHSGADIELSVTGAPGASLLVVGLGGGPAQVPDWPLPGLIGYVAPLAVTIGAVSSGNPGEPGTGGLLLPVRVPPIMTGSLVTLQAWAFDGAAPAGQVLQTNGLFLAFR